MDSNESTKALPICTSKQRMDFIRSRCTSDEKKSIPSARFVVDHDRKIAFCHIPKNGCTTWKTVMANNTRNAPHLAPERNPKGYIHSHLSNHGLSLEKYSTKIENYTKFAVLRHPFDRFLSAYRDKALQRKYGVSLSLRGQYKTIRDYALATFNHDQLNSTERETYLLNVTEFLYYVLHTSNIHWNPYTHRCSMCTINYDYVLRIETMENDCQVITHKLYPEVKQCPMFNAYSSRSTREPRVKPKVLNHFNILDNTLMDKMLEMYGQNMYKFGYSFDRNTLEASCMVETENGGLCC